MREPRIYVGAVLAIVAWAVYVQAQPPTTGPVGPRTFQLPTRAPTPFPTPAPTVDPLDEQIGRYVLRYGGTPAAYLDMIDGDCSALRERLAAQADQMAALERATDEWLLAFGFSRALTWRREQMGC
jgi:hypothetical protein